MDHTTTAHWSRQWVERACQGHGRGVRGSFWVSTGPHSKPKRVMTWTESSALSNRMNHPVRTPRLAPHGHLELGRHAPQVSTASPGPALGQCAGRPVGQGPPASLPPLPGAGLLPLPELWVSTGPVRTASTPHPLTWPLALIPEESDSCVFGRPSRTLTPRLHPTRAGQACATGD